jgi:hypothetical protein
VSNTAPVLAPIGNKTVNEGVELSFTASATDFDVPANTITYSLAAGTGCTGSEICSVPSGASIGSSSGDFSWTPNFTQAGFIAFMFPFFGTLVYLIDLTSESVGRPSSVTPEDGRRSRTLREDSRCPVPRVAVRFAAPKASQPSAP